MIEVAPVSLFPSPFPERLFLEAKEVQTSMNLVMHKIGHDPQFLNSSLESSIQVDEFTRDLLKVYNDAQRIGLAQELNFGLFRADYMVDDSKESPSLKQVEANAIASGFAGLGPKVLRLHRHMVSKYLPERLHKLPDNLADVNYATRFIEAFDAYGNEKAIILFIVEDRSINICDQRTLEFSISSLRPDIRILRRSLNELQASSVLTENRLFLIDKNGLEVALVYFRVCYDPSHYSQETWKLRLKIEMSKAIKCPSINYQLAGVKKFQQILTKPDILERFLDTIAAEKLRNTFTGIWGLERDDPEGNRAVEMALEDPNRFVLKPQREGGGNNIYGRDIAILLEPIRNEDKREAYILMEMIRTPVIHNFLIGSNVETPLSGHMITSELGIFGSILASKDQVLFNREDGHVLRSKKLGVNEGGISAGFGAIDSPFLF